MRLLPVLLLFAIAGLAPAQERLLDRFKPRTPEPLAPSTETRQDTGPAVPAVSSDAASPIKARGFVFLSGLPQFKPSGVSGVSGVQTAAVPMLDNEEFRAQVSQYLDKPVTMDLVNAVSVQAIRYHMQHDRPVVSVTAPEQDVTDGVIQFVVNEGRVGQVTVEGNRWFKSSLFKIRAKPGEPILMSHLDADTAFYGRNPFRSVVAELGQGKANGETDITLRVQDKFPLRVYAGYENSGVESTGENRLFAGFNYGNLFGLGQELSYQVTTDADFESLLAHSATWTIPLPWKHLLVFSGVYSESTPEMEEGFDFSGESWQVGARYVIPLRKIGRLEHEVSLGYDFKFTNNNLQFGGVEIFDTPVEISEFSLAYSASLPDKLGRTSFAFATFWSPGNMSRYNDDESFEAARVDSSADYVYFTAGLDRVTKLPFGLTWFLSTKGQWSDGNLQATEQWLLGGQNTVRGYDELVVSADSGLLVRNEFYTPPVSLGKMLHLPVLNDQLQFLVFHDFGTAQIADPLEGEDDSTQLQSAGVGVRWQVRQNLSVRFDYGWQIDDIGLEDDSRAHLSVTLSF